MTPVPVKVVGFQYAKSHYPWSVLWLAERVFAADVDPVHEPGLWDLEPVGDLDRCGVRLVREPNNPADPNAIRVEVPALADGGFHPFVGYVEAPVAAVYAERMDDGWTPTAWVASIRVKSPVELDRPGLRIYVEWGTEPQTLRRPA